MTKSSSSCVHPAQLHSPQQVDLHQVTERRIWLGQPRNTERRQGVGLWAVKTLTDRIVMYKICSSLYPSICKQMLFCKKNCLSGQWDWEERSGHTLACSSRNAILENTSSAEHAVLETAELPCINTWNTVWERPSGEPETDQIYRSHP